LREVGFRDGGEGFGGDVADATRRWLAKGVGCRGKRDALVIQIPQKLVVQPLDILVRAHALLQVLILAPAVDRVVDHDPVHVVVLVGLEDGLFDVDPDVGRVAERGAGRADEAEFVGDAEGFAGFAGELRGANVVSDERSSWVLFLPSPF
jgi:hypothetical protein